MNRYFLIRRLRGPAFLLLVGMNALLAQAHILGWGQSWPLYLILAGVLLLAERAALAGGGDAPWFSGASTPPQQQPPPGQPSQSDLSIVPTRPRGFDEVNGGQS